MVWPLPCSGNVNNESTFEQHGKETPRTQHHKHTKEMARLVRKQSLWSRIQSYPLDLLLELNEQRELIDWDAYSETVALPLGSGLTLLYFFIRLWQDNSAVKQQSSPYFRYDRAVLKGSKYFMEHQQPSFFQRIVDFVQFVIIIINVVNTISFLLKTKKYAIFNKDTIGKTSSARKVSGSTPSFSLFNPFSNTTDNEDEQMDSYWELTMWNPSKFSTFLFVSFPPFNIAFLYIATSSFTNLGFLIMTSAVLYVVIVKGYLVLIQDKQVLYQETFDEYERKYVKPKLSAARREVAVDATRGPYGHESIQYYSPGRTEKVFKTHDRKGRESVEFYHGGEFTPVKRPPNSLRKSIVTHTPRDRRITMAGYQPSPLSKKSLR